MGENEQGGMLRVVTVLGLIAIIAAVVIFGVVSMKAPLRTNTLMARDAGKNLVEVPLGQKSSSVFKGLGKTVIVDGSSQGELSFVVPADGQNYGVYTGPGGAEANAQNSLFRIGDKWQAGADVRVSSTDGISLKNLFVEGSNNTNWISRPALSTDWQHFQDTGVRSNYWGTYLIYFTNNGTQPVTVSVKNLELYRIG